MTGPNSCVDKNAIDQWNSLPRRSDLSTAQAQIETLTKERDALRERLNPKKNEPNPVCIHCLYYEGYCHFGYSPEPKKRPEGCTGSVIKPDSPVAELGEKKPQDKYGFKEPDSDNPFNSPDDGEEKVCDWCIGMGKWPCDCKGECTHHKSEVICQKCHGTGRIQEKGVKA